MLRLPSNLTNNLSDVPDGYVLHGTTAIERVRDELWLDIELTDHLILADDDKVRYMEHFERDESSDEPIYVTAAEVAGRIEAAFAEYDADGC
jgi:hypothetical protein